MGKQVYLFSSWEFTPFVSCTVCSLFLAQCFFHNVIFFSRLPKPLLLLQPTCKPCKLFLYHSLGSARVRLPGGINCPYSVFSQTGGHIAFLLAVFMRVCIPGWTGMIAPPFHPERDLDWTLRMFCHWSHIGLLGQL